MRLPVSRARYDSELQFVALQRDNERAMVATLKTSLAVADHRARAAEAAHRDLLEKYHSLRIEGAVLQPPPSVPSVEKAIPREQDELKALIGEVCGRDYHKRAMMLRALTVDRAAKVPESDIRAAILNGVQADGVPA